MTLHSVCVVLLSASLTWAQSVPLNSPSPSDNPKDLAHEIEGSAQEFDGTRILGRFPEDDEFGLEGGHPLRLQQEVAEISIAASSTE